MLDRQTLGHLGEDAAARAYRDRGFAIVARNWRCRSGEIDLVLARDGLLVFCEVKTRTGFGFGGGYEAVTPTKQRKVRQLAVQFLAWTQQAPRGSRFDVASVAPRRGRPGGFDVQIFEDAF